MDNRRFGKLTTAISGHVIDSYKVLVNTIRAVQPEFQGPSDIHNTPCLPEQLVNQVPPNWIPVELVGRGDQKIEIALRSDNLNLAGFKNKHGQWFELRSDSKGPLIPGSILLPFGGSYRDLLGPEWESILQRLQLSKTDLLDAIEFIFSHPSSNISEDYLKRAITVVIIMICEAARLNPIRNMIFNSWPHPVKLDKQFAKFPKLWCNLSMFILCKFWGTSWKHSGGVDELKHNGITTFEEAIGMVNIISWPTVFKTNNLAHSCTLECPP